MRKRLLFALAAMSLASAAQAASYTSAGCGLGAMMFEGKKGKAHLVLASFFNFSISGNQTFGISSETLGCTADGVVKNDKKLEVYASVNYDKLAKEAAQGGGEYLAALGNLLGVKDQKAFFAAAQSSHEKLFMGDSAALVEGLKAL